MKHLTDYGTVIHRRTRCASKRTYNVASDRKASLARALAHLAALAPEAAHALLAPLCTHAPVDVEEHGEGVRFFNPGVGQRAGVELYAAMVEAHDGRRKVLLGLHRRLDSCDRGGRGHLQREASPAEGFHEDLHVFAPGCSQACQRYQGVREGTA